MSWLCRDCMYWTGDEDDSDMDGFRGRCAKSGKDTLAISMCDRFICGDCRECQDCEHWNYLGRDRYTKTDFGQCKKRGCKRWAEEPRCVQFVQGRGPDCRCFDQYFRFAQEPGNLNYCWRR